ncbi:MAG: response regulator [Candidatus Omnitrophica bacterium]|nr:response regulator [Candidatus Omnitrophota bacterium]
MAYKKILVVDDEEDFLMMLEKRLMEEGFEVITATEGQEAIKKCKRYLPDLVLMDIILPDFDGSEVVKILLKDPSTRDIPVIFLSGIVTPGADNASPEVNIGGRTFQALGKPFPVEDLLNLLEGCITD